VSNQRFASHVSYRPNNDGYSYYIANISNRMVFVIDTNSSSVSQEMKL